MTLMQRLIDAGYPKEDIDHHESDLYVFDTPLTRKIVREYCIENGWDNLARAMDDAHINTLAISTFTDNITGKPMLDLALQYQEETDENQR